MASSETPNEVRLSMPEAPLFPLLLPKPEDIANGHAHKLRMTDEDLKGILRGVESALEVFRKNEGNLRALDIGLKSMLGVVKIQVEAELSAEGKRQMESIGQSNDSFKSSDEVGSASL